MITRYRVVEILNQNSFYTTNKFEDNYELFKNDNLISIYLGSCYIESEEYPTAYDFKHSESEEELTTYINGLLTE